MSDPLRDALQGIVNVLGPDHFGGELEGLVAEGNEALRIAREALAASGDDIEAELRKELWLNHGHSFSVLYGDDGEMQCAACLCDFKRQPLDEVRQAALIGRATASRDNAPSIRGESDLRFVRYAISPDASEKDRAEALAILDAALAAPKEPNR